MSKSYRSRRNKSTLNSSGEDTMAEDKVTVSSVQADSEGKLVATLSDGSTVSVSRKIKPVETPGVTSTPQLVEATFGKVEGKIVYPRNVATTADGALAMADALGYTKTVKNEKGEDVEQKLDSVEAFLKVFNSGYDAGARITARNELAVVIEGPEKQLNAVASRIAKIKYGNDDEASIAKVKALPEFASLVAVMS